MSVVIDGNLTKKDAIREIQKRIDDADRSIIVLSPNNIAKAFWMGYAQAYRNALAIVESIAEPEAFTPDGCPHPAFSELTDQDPCPICNDRGLIDDIPCTCASGRQYR